jgi:hypothetical protein
MELGTEVDLNLMKGKHQLSVQEANKYISENMGWTSIRSLGRSV